MTTTTIYRRKHRRGGHVLDGPLVSQHAHFGARRKKRVLHRGGNLINKALEFLKKHKVISRVSSYAHKHLPTAYKPIAKAVHGLASSYGYGRRKRRTRRTTRPLKIEGTVPISGLGRRKRVRPHVLGMGPGIMTGIGQYLKPTGDGRKRRKRVHRKMMPVGGDGRRRVHRKPVCGEGRRRVHRRVHRGGSWLGDIHDWIKKNKVISRGANIAGKIAGVIPGGSLFSPLISGIEHTSSAFGYGRKHHHHHHAHHMMHRGIAEGRLHRHSHHHGTGTIYPAISSFYGMPKF